MNFTSETIWNFNFQSSWKSSGCHGWVRPHPPLETRDDINTIRRTLLRSNIVHTLKEVKCISTCWVACFILISSLQIIVKCREFSSSNERHTQAWAAKNWWETFSLEKINKFYSLSFHLFISPPNSPSNSQTSNSMMLSRDYFNCDFIRFSLRRQECIRGLYLHIYYIKKN